MQCVIVTLIGHANFLEFFGARKILEIHVPIAFAI